MNLVLASALLACFSLASASPFENCGLDSSYGAQLNDVDIEGCDNEKCEFKANTNVKFTIKFTPKRATDKLQATLSRLNENIFATGGTNYLNIEDSDACKVLDCPVEVGQEYTYTSKFRATGSSYKDADIQLQFLLNDHPNTRFLCVTVKALLKAPETEMRRF